MHASVGQRRQGASLIATASIEVNGLRIAYDRVGTGPLLVLLHGVLGDRRLWRPQLEALSDRFTVIAWDCPGCGESDDPQESVRLPQFAGWLAGLIAALGLDRPHVLGLSWGAGLALELYSRYPTLPRSLVLAAAYAGWAGSLPAEEVERRRQQCLRESNLPPRQFVPGWIPDLLTDAAPPAMVDAVMEIMAGFHPVGFRTMVQAFAQADLREVLPRISVPTMLLYGAADLRSPLSVAQSLHTRIPDSHLVVVPGVGHLSNVEAPERFNSEVRDFLYAADQGSCGDSLRQDHPDVANGTP